MKKFVKRLIASITAAVMSVSVLSFSAFAENQTEELAAAMLEGALKREKEIDISDIVNRNKWNLSDTTAFLSDAYLICPELFFASNSIGAGNLGSRYFISLEYVMTEAEYKTAKERLDTAVNKIVAGITSDMTDLEKALYVHDYLILNCKYDYTKSKYDMYDCLIDRSAVCQGYSLAYMYILKNFLNIDCTVVYSKAMSHAWNYVRIGKNWYHVDVTNDDASTAYKNTSYDNLGYAMHEYFMMSDAFAKKTTKPHYDWNVIGDYPAATDTSFDNAPWRDSNSPIVLIGKTGYYVTKNDTLGVSELSAYNFGNNTSKTLVRIKCKWYSVRNESGTEFHDYGTCSYKKIWMSVAYRNGKLYFNTNQSVYSYDLATKKSKKLFTLSKGNKQIFGMMFTSADRLRIAYREDITYPESYLTLKLK